MKKRYKIGLTLTAIAFALAYVLHSTPKEKEAKYLRRGNELLEKGEFKKARLEFKNAANIMPNDPEVSYRWALVDEAEGDIRSAYLNFLYSEQQGPHFHPVLLKLAHYEITGDQLEEAQKHVNTALSDSPEDPEAHALNGALLLRKKDYQGAKKEAHFAQQKDPANITAISVLTGIFSAEGKLDKAGQAVDEGIALNPKDVSLLMLKAQLYDASMNLPKITEAYQGIFKLRPEETQYRMYLSEIYIKAKKIDDAEKILRDGIEAAPDDWAIKHRLIDFLASYRTTEAAEKEIHALISQYPQRDELYFWLSDLYISHNAVDKAIKLLEEIISQDKTPTQSLNARASLARIHFVKGNKELAEKLMNAVLEKAPTNTEALMIRATMNTDQGLYQSAVSDLRIILREKPQSIEALQLLGEVLLLQGYTDLAIETQNQLMEVDSVNPAVKVRLAQMYHANGDLKRARELLDTVTKTAPRYAIGWENLARVAIAMKDWETAKAAIQTLDQMEGQHMTASYLQAQILEKSGNNNDAMSEYTKIIDANPNSPLAERALFSLVEEHHSPQEMESTIKYIASLKTNSPYVSTILGECYLVIGKTDQAKTAFEKALDNNPISQEPFLHLADLYMSDNKPDQALALLKKAASLIPTDIRAQIAEAQVLGVQGNYNEAITLYQSIMKRNPEINDIANNFAITVADHAFDDTQLLQKASQVTEKFENSTNPFLVDTLAWVYYRQGKTDQALKLFAHAVSLQDKLPAELHYHYGATLLKAGKLPEAKVELQKATADNEPYPALDDAKKLLNGL